MKPFFYLTFFCICAVLIIGTPNHALGNSGIKKATHRKKESKTAEYRPYNVKKGETLFRVSKRFNITVNELCTANGITEKDQVMAGTLLKIPSSNHFKESKKISSSNVSSMMEKKAKSPGPAFIWPVRDVLNYSDEASAGVKSIGIKITGKPGSPVLSAASGVVCRIGRMRGYGNYIVITHKDRFATVYANLNTILVTEGDSISRGKIIGRIGSDDKTIHFQIDREGKPTNPLALLPKRS